VAGDPLDRALALARQIGNRGAATERRVARPSPDNPA
jgi:hypothetical protein